MSLLAVLLSLFACKKVQRLRKNKRRMRKTPRRDDNKEEGRNSRNKKTDENRITHRGLMERKPSALFCAKNKKKPQKHRVFKGFVVEVWRFEPTVSGTRSRKFIFFDYQTLHIARIFRKTVSFCTLFPLFPNSPIPVVVSYVVKTEIAVKSGKRRALKSLFSP